MYAVKFQERQLDLIIVVYDLAVNFILNYGMNIFKDIPIIFIISNDTLLERTKSVNNAFNILYQVDLVSSLEHIRKLLPNTENVYVIADASSLDTYYFSLAQKSFKPFEDIINITYINNLDVNPLVKMVESLQTGQSFSASSTAKNLQAHPYYLRM